MQETIRNAQDTRNTLNEQGELLQKRETINKKKKKEVRNEKK